MDPRPRLCVLENVPGLLDKDKDTGRSNFDAVQDAFTAMGFAFTSKVWDALQTGIPNARKRLYMVAIPGMPEGVGAGLTAAVHASVAAQLEAVIPQPLSDFLLDEYAPHEMIKDWMPDRSTRQTKTTMGSSESQLAHMKSRWESCSHASDKELYVRRLRGNPWFHLLTPREQDILLLHLCHYPYPGPAEGVVTVQTSGTFSRLVTHAVPTQVPNAKFWLVARDRLQTGAEAIMLQGVDLVDIPSFGIGSHTSNFLQDLAGNAFCVRQFVVWLLACMPEVPTACQQACCE